MSSSPEAPETVPVHVAMVLDERFVDDAGAVLSRLCVGMVDEAIQVTVVTPVALPDELLIGAVRVLTYRARRWPFRSHSVRALFGQVAPRRPTVIHALSGRAVKIGRALAAQFGVPLITQVNGHDEIGPAVRSRLVPPAAIVCASEPLREAIRRRRHRTDDQRLRLVRPGVHPQAAPTCFVDPAKMATVVTRVALTERCRVADVMQAAARLKERGVELMLFVLGTGPAEPALRELTKTLGLRREAIFAGQMHDASSAIEGGDILVVPRAEKTFSVATLEALAAGLAVVGARGGAGDFLIDGQTGLLYEEGNVEQLIQQLAHLLEDRSFAKDLAARALAYVKQNHQTSAMVRSLSELYRQLSVEREAERPRRRE